MSERSAIEWTDASWTPLRARKGRKVGWHCELASPGCQNCYSQRQNKWTGTGLPFVRRSRDEVAPFLDEKILTAPLRWKEPKKIFVCANTDLFGEWVPDEWIDRIFAVMALTPWHTYQILTKRAGRMREYFAAEREFLVEPSPDRTLAIIRGMEPIVGRGAPFAEKGLTAHLGGENRLLPLPNVWLGVSAEDQQRLEERVPDLLATPAAVRWVSAEPLLGPLDFQCGICAGEFGQHYRDCSTDAGRAQRHIDKLPQIDWIVVGGESGPGARPCDVAWVRDIVRQCREAKNACFVKQLGSVWAGSQWAKEGNPSWNRKGGEPAEWPEDLRVREFAEVRP